jgi:formylglycine-generating enzyme required for sulfatase activity
MQGNVFEWCQDYYRNYLGGTALDPQGTNTGSSRLFRGGSWFIGGRYCRSAYRYSLNPGSRFDDFGFRVVLAPGQP